VWGDTILVLAAVLLICEEGRKIVTGWIPVARRAAGKKEGRGGVGGCRRSGENGGGGVFSIAKGGGGGERRCGGGGVCGRNPFSPEVQKGKYLPVSVIICRHL